MELHHAEVSAHSAGPGSGTEVVIRIPALADARDTSAPVERDRPPRTLSPSRILIADDNEDAAEVLALMLRSAGHEVETVHDGVEALRRGPDFAPDIVLLDLGMPRLNGYETARGIRAEAWGRQVSLVALTGWGQSRDRTRTREVGFDAHLVKPVSNTELFDVLHAVTQMGASTRRAPGPGAREG